jgi:hypothetical protein
MQIDSAELHGDLLLLRIGKYGLQSAQRLVSEFKPWDYDITRTKLKRSLDANAYAWVLITKLGDALRRSKEQVYLDMLKQYGQSEIVSVKSDINVSGYFKYYEEAGRGKVGNMEFTHYKVYKGSSEYDTREMSVLIDGIVSECKDQDIETLTPVEIERMKSEWR